MAERTPGTSLISTLKLTGDTGLLNTSRTATPPKRGHDDEEFFFFLIVMAIVFHKTKQQNKMLQVPISRRALQKRAK
jgi:hypothetical protein